MENLLVFSGTAPGENGVGGIFLAHLLSFVPEGNVSFCWLKDRMAGEPKFKTITAGPIINLVRRYETSFRPIPGFLGGIISGLSHFFLFSLHATKLGRDVFRFGVLSKPTRILAILDCPTTIELAETLARRLTVPLYVLVWDPPEWLAEQLGYDWFSKARHLKKFEKAICFAKGVAVIGETMQAAFKERYGVQSVILRHGLPFFLWHEVSTQLADNGKLVIGFAGSMTAPDSFGALIKALNRVNWNIGGREVQIRLCGCRYLCEPDSPQNIEFLGRRRTVQETVDILATADVLYLPQPFNSKMEAFARLSFPTKLSSYLAAGRPIFLHAPGYASLVDFSRRFRFGLWCGSLVEKMILESLEKLITDRDVYALAGKEGSRCLKEELNEQVFFHRFREFLEIP